MSYCIDQENVFNGLNNVHIKVGINMFHYFNGYKFGNNVFFFSESC